MKKVLSVLLATALALGCAVCAFAAKEPAPPLPERPGGEPKFKSYVEEMPALQGLSYELPTVTGIEAEWNGETLISNWGLYLYFSPENVTITVSFEDEDPEELTYWWDSGNSWFWEVFYEYDAEAGKVVFYYADSNLYNAFYESLDELGGEYDWDEEWQDFLATLPQAVVTVPANLREQYLNSLEKTALKLGESKKVAVAGNEFKMFSFTPEKNGPYHFYSENPKDYAYSYAVLADASYAVIATYRYFCSSAGFDIISELQAGKTYYLAAWGYPDDGETAEFDVAVSNDVRKLSGLQWIAELLTGGLFRRYWVNPDYYGPLYSIPGKSTWMQNAMYNLGAIRDWILSGFFARPRPIE